MSRWCVIVVYVSTAWEKVNILQKCAILDGIVDVPIGLSIVVLHFHVATPFNTGDPLVTPSKFIITDDLSVVLHE